jgi:hypothetical protein
MPDEHLQQVLGRGRLEQETDNELPEPGEAYQAYARANNKPVYSLHCVLGKEGVRTFQYIHLDSSSSFETVSKGQLITLRFSGSRLWEVKILGRNLWRLYDYLHQHRMPWIVRADRDFSTDKEPIVVAIEILEPPDANA